MKRIVVTLALAAAAAQANAYMGLEVLDAMTPAMQTAYIVGVVEASDESCVPLGLTPRALRDITITAIAREELVNVPAMPAVKLALLRTFNCRFVGPAGVSTKSLSTQETLLMRLSSK